MWDFSSLVAKIFMLLLSTFLIKMHKTSGWSISYGFRWTKCEKLLNRGKIDKFWQLALQLCTVTFFPLLWKFMKRLLGQSGGELGTKCEISEHLIISLKHLL